MKTTKTTAKKSTTSKVCPNCGKKFKGGWLFCSNECVIEDQERTRREQSALTARLRATELARKVFLEELKAENYLPPNYQKMKMDERLHEEFMLENGII